MVICFTAIHKGPFCKLIKKGFPLEPISEGSITVVEMTSVMEVHFTLYMWLIDISNLLIVDLFQFVRLKGMLYVKTLLLIFYKLIVKHEDCFV